MLKVKSDVVLKNLCGSKMGHMFALDAVADHGDNLVALFRRKIFNLASMDERVATSRASPADFHND